MGAGEALTVPEALVARIEAMCRASFEGVFPADCDWDRVARDFVSEERCEEQLELLARMLPTELSGKRLLEVGSGYGMFVAVAARGGIDAHGVEPGRAGGCHG